MARFQRIPLRPPNFYKHRAKTGLQASLGSRIMEAPNQSSQNHMREQDAGIEPGRSLPWSLCLYVRLLALPCIRDSALPTAGPNRDRRPRSIRPRMFPRMPSLRWLGRTGRRMSIRPDVRGLPTHRARAELRFPSTSAQFWEHGIRNYFSEGEGDCSTARSRRLLESTKCISCSPRPRALRKPPATLFTP